MKFQASKIRRLQTIMISLILSTFNLLFLSSFLEGGGGQKTKQNIWFNERSESQFCCKKNKVKQIMIKYNSSYFFFLFFFFRFHIFSRCSAKNGMLLQEKWLETVSAKCIIGNTSLAFYVRWDGIQKNNDVTRWQ